MSAQHTPESAARMMDIADKMVELARSIREDFPDLSVSISRVASDVEDAVKARTMNTKTAQHTPGPIPESVAQADELLSYAGLMTYSEALECLQAYSDHVERMGWSVDPNGRIPKIRAAIARAEGKA